MKTHLFRCIHYRKSLDNPGIPRPTPLKSNQPTVVERLRLAAAPPSDSLTESAAKAILVSGASLSILNQPFFKIFLQDLRPAGSVWTPPSRDAIIDTWLPVIYEKTRLAVIQRILRPAPMLNIIFDASDDISGRRQVNISISSPDAPAVFWRMIDTGSVRHTAVEVAAIIKSEIDELLQDEDKGYMKVNAFISDTCSTAISTCKSLAAHKDLQHTFSVFCDSHGLQLLIKDLFSPQQSPLKPTFQRFMSIASFFKNSTLQMSRLRDEQQQIYQNNWAILTGSYTRWGSHFKALTSLRRSKDALQAYAHRMATAISRNEISGTEASSIGPYIDDLLAYDFWYELDALIALVEPVDEAIRSSEADRSDPGYVVKRWNEILAKWQVVSRRYHKLDWPFIFHTYDARKSRQITDINWLAFALHPDRPSLDDAANANVLIKLQALASDLQNREVCVHEFIQFRSQIGRFASTKMEWQLDLPPRLFWASFQEQGSKLALIAGRVFGCIANSVPAERAFSSMNFIKNSNTNRLSSNSLDMWLFVYINARVLRKVELGQPFEDDKADDADNDGAEGLIERILQGSSLVLDGGEEFRAPV